MDDTARHEAATGQAMAAAVGSGRVDPAIGSLRTHSARGTLINAAFMIGLAGLGLIRQVAVVGFLTREEFGLWGIMIVTLVTLVWLKEIGIGDKYIQQSEPDQELAFQKAFTLELAVSCGYFALCALALPAFALAYGHMELIAPGMVLATTVLLSAFQTPTLIPYRRLQYRRQRTLSSVEPVVGVVATVALAAAGFGVWGLVAGAVIGGLAGAGVCIATSPYRLRLRFDRATAREYVSFSWPLFAMGVSSLVAVQGMLLVANHAVGLAGVGAIGLATTVAAFANRVDDIISQTIYPAVCAVAGRVDLMAEVFEKSNRVALMWAMPFGAGAALFAGDLIHFGFGREWASAQGIVAAVCVACALGQIAFNWGVFMRALDRTRPLLVAALMDVGVFLLVTAPSIVLFGLTGFAVSFCVAVLIQVAVRTYFMRSLFAGFSTFRQFWRAVAPVVPPVVLIAILRVIEAGHRTLPLALFEVALFAVGAALCTWAFERSLVRELVGYVRGRRVQAAATAGMV